MPGTISTRNSQATTSERGILLWGEPWRAWLLLLVGVCAVSAQSASSLAFSVLMKPMTAALEIDRTTFASAMSLRMLLMVLALALVGLATDKAGARAVLVAGACVVGLGTVGLALLPSSAWLYPVMGAIGPGQAAIGSVAASALVVRHFTVRRGWAVGILNGGDNLLNSAVPLLTAAILQRHGWRAALVVVGAAYLALAALVALVLRRDDGKEVRSPKLASRTDGETRKSPGKAFWLLVLVYVGIYAFITSVQLHLHSYLTDLGLSPIVASRVLSVQILVGALGAPLIGGAAGRWGARPTLCVTVGGLAVGALLLWNVGSNFGFLGWALFYGTVNSGVVALLALALAELFGPAQIGRWMGVAMSFCMGSTMVANVYSAAMFDRFGTYLPVWQGYSALMMALLLPVAILTRWGDVRAKTK
jgi:MFS family permease